MDTALAGGGPAGSGGGAPLLAGECCLRLVSDLERARRPVEAGDCISSIASATMPAPCPSGVAPTEKSSCPSLGGRPAAPSESVSASWPGASSSLGCPACSAPRARRLPRRASRCCSARQRPRSTRRARMSLISAFMRPLRCRSTPSWSAPLSASAASSGFGCSDGGGLSVADWPAAAPARYCAEKLCRAAARLPGAGSGSGSSSRSWPKCSLKRLERGSSEGDTSSSGGCCCSSSSSPSASLALPSLVASPSSSSSPTSSGELTTSKPSPSASAGSSSSS
mmetsp:Transcript_39506/g.100174  ORF Transcript_39506/g.100174 Transcript_39506/m.100174 type:complete len:281 (-) Transcript_39506:1630-2472(-)